MNLLLIRHAVAMDRDEYKALHRSSTVAFDDGERPLTEDGIRKMKKNAKGLRRLVPEPALLLTSPLKRTVQTTEILQGVWPAARRSEIVELKPGTHPEKLLDWFRHHGTFQKSLETVAVVGHETQLSVLIAWLLAGSAPFGELKKGGACLIQFKAAPKKQRGSIIWLATPKILKSLR